MFEKDGNFPVKVVWMKKWGRLGWFVDDQKWEDEWEGV